MAGSIGMQFRAFTKNEFLRGAIGAPGTKRTRQDPNVGSREFVVVKFTAGATHINGSLLTIDGDCVATLGTVGAAPGVTGGGRAAILAITATATSTSTQTIAATAFAWAQIYGKGAVRAATISVMNNALQFGANGVAILGAAGSASAALVGMHNLATSGAAGLVPVMLQYPHFTGLPI